MVEPAQNRTLLISRQVLYHRANSSPHDHTLTHDILVLCSDSAAAKAYCENTVCPSLSASSSTVKPDTCCVWHVNIHSCPISTNVSYCGPWISPSGTLYTHSAVLWGDVNRGNWTSNVRTLQTIFFLLPSGSEQHEVLLFGSI